MIHRRNPRDRRHRRRASAYFLSLWRAPTATTTVNSGDKLRARARAQSTQLPLARARARATVNKQPTRRLATQIVDCAIVLRGVKLNDVD